MNDSASTFTINLNGKWRFMVDQDPEYHRHFDYSKAVCLGRWEEVKVPGCWNKYDARYDLFEGVAWFVRDFDAGKLPEEHVARLNFGGVNYLADVFLNGQKVGSHEGGYTAFDMDASKVLQNGKNRLAVRVDNRHLKMRLPAVIGWYNYGGIHRDVTLTVTRVSRIAGVRVDAAPQGAGAKGTLVVATATASSELTVRARIMNSEGVCLWRGEGPVRDTQGKFSFELEKARPWSPETPQLYHCEVELLAGAEVLDRRGISFGIRTLAAEGARILINGKPLFLRGMCYIYDHPATGVVFDPDVVKHDLDDLQAMGVNCLRSHFPAPDFFLDECDRRGMMLWLEAPIYCLNPKSSAGGTAFSDSSVKNLAVNMLREMVLQAVNHPSVIIWSVGNECNAEHPEAEAFFRACVEQVRALDRSRLIGYASYYGNIGCLQDQADVIGINQYWGWYERIRQDGAVETAPAINWPCDLSKLDACLREKSALGKPLLLTEFGADAEPGFRSAGLDLWSEDYQAALIQKHMEIAGKYPAVCGTFPFCYADYRDPSKPVNHHWRGINLKGVVDYHRNHKLAWPAVQKIYNPNIA
ncbi:MAG: glycoside hydrolase family 2 TIM barrel-domain containing protein [Kiritimatiellae bacterium]|nr:glycoside hydrolase family 2 TIM barrel-domain containing protein [Kiritimatiellia bacterium]